MVRATFHDEVEEEAIKDHKPILSDRWHPMRYHAGQQAFHLSTKRFNIVPAGRRSGKTEWGKRRLVKKAIRECMSGWRYIAAAPTYNQAKEIFWSDLKQLVPNELIAGQVRESGLQIPLTNGAIIIVMGMDKPERAEGKPIAHFLGDEIGNWKPNVWNEHIRPALADPNYPGTADLIGCPEGRNDYYDLWMNAIGDPEWDRHTWFSSDILSAVEMAALKRQLDVRTFRQECEASWETFVGLAYYCWSDDNVGDYTYDPKLPLNICFDFNKEPGVAAFVQEWGGATYVIGEIYVPSDSTTPTVCVEIAERMGHHKGRVYLYGDATGGAGGSAKVMGSDWENVETWLRTTFPLMDTCVPTHNPPQIRRINAVNSRLCAMDGTRRLFVDKTCIETRKDFEGTKLKEGTHELDKKDLRFTHLTDAVGYMIEYKYPSLAGRTEVEQI